jgi:hypothetical protein
MEIQGGGIMIDLIKMCIIDKETGISSNMVSLRDIIFNQHDIEFEFSDGSTLPYKDFLFYQEDYIVFVDMSMDGEVES